MAGTLCEILVDGVPDEAIELDHVDVSRAAGERRIDVAPSAAADHQRVRVGAQHVSDALRARQHALPGRELAADGSVHGAYTRS